MTDMYDEKEMPKPIYVWSKAERESAQRESLLMNNDKLDKNNYHQEIDHFTDFGKGITFKSVDGKDWPTYEDAMAYNQLYYEKMMIKSEEYKGMHK